MIELQDISKASFNLAKSSFKYLIKLPYALATHVRHENGEYAGQPDYIICGGPVCLPIPSVGTFTLLGSFAGLIFNSSYSVVLGSDSYLKFLGNQNLDLKSKAILSLPLLTNIISGGYEYLRKNNLERKLNQQNQNKFSDGEKK